MAGYEFKDKVVIPADKAIAWQKDIYMAGGMNDKDALTTANCLVTADLRGVYSHGIIRTPVYIAHFQKKNIDPRAQPEIVRQSPAAALVDGHNAMGMVVGAFAAELAIKMAREMGSASISVTGSNHLGTCAHYAEMAADADMVGIFWTISGANNMAPWGGVEARLTNNPFAIAVPCKTKPNVVMDIATSVVPRGKILVASKGDNVIPEGWAFDRQGRPTTNAKEAMVGTLAPMGGYKGIALSFISTVITSIINNSKYGPYMANTFGQGEQKLNSGHLMQAINIAAITEVDEFKARMDEYVEWIKSCPKAEGTNEIFVPGEIEQNTRKRQTVEGIAYPRTVIEENMAVSKELGVAAPL